MDYPKTPLVTTYCGWNIYVSRGGTIWSAYRDDDMLMAKTLAALKQRIAIYSLGGEDYRN